MRVQQLGESAWIVSEIGDRPAHALAGALRALNADGIDDVVASYATVGIYTQGAGIALEEIEALLERAADLPTPEPKLHRIPVCYERGLDLAEVAQALHLDTESVIGEHLSVEYACYAVGFCPGFPYLGDLTDALAPLGRRPTPRTRIDPGTVAIAKGLTGIYPIVRPGGWWLIGQTPLTMVDLRDRYFPISAGDRVRFERIDEAEFSRLKGERL